MRILYICSTDLSGESGSAGSVRHIMEVAENLCRRGHRVRLIAPGYTRYTHQTPVAVWYVPLIKKRFVRTLIPELLAPLFFVAAVLSMRPSCIYWRQSYLTIAPPLLARIFRRPLITEVNGLTLDEVESEHLPFLRKAIVLLFERINYRLSHHLICVAPRIRERLCEHYGLNENKVSVILNGVNADRMPPVDPRKARQEIGIAPTAKVVGFVGHLFPWDGVEYLIEAAPAIIRREPSVLFLIIGHGQWGNHLVALSEQAGVAPHFRFTGKVPWERLYLYINAFTVATAPYALSINEQSGRSSLKILEYLALCKPVVASRSTAIPEIIEIEKRHFGITVAPENADELAGAIGRLLHDPKLCRQMGVGGREYVTKERSWRGVAAATEQILLRECR